MYNAFISYSHKQDSHLAPSLEEALEKFAKPLFKKRALEVFRDSNDLSVSPDLWGDIEMGLKNSEFFVLLASPAAAKSKWCKREVEYWKSNKSIKHFLIVLTDGELVWDEDNGDFNWHQTTAIPENLSGSFLNEPLYVDFRGTYNKEDLRLENPEFKTKLVLLAATIHGKTVGNLIGEATRKHRRLIQLRNGTIAILLAFLGYSIFQTNRAIAEKNKAQANYLFSEANNFVEKDPTLSFALTREAMKKQPNDKKFDQHARDLYAKFIFYTSIMYHDSTVTCVKFSPSGESMISASKKTTKLWDLNGNVLQEFIGHTKAVLSIAFSPNGKNIITGSEDNTAKLWDLNGRVVQEYRIEEDNYGVSSVAFSPDGKTIVTGSVLGKVCIWDLEGNLVPDEGSHFDSSHGMGENLAISPDGTLIVGCNTVNNLVLWNLNEYQHRDYFDTSEDLLRFSSVAFSPDGCNIWTGDNYGIRLWDLNGYREDILDKRYITDVAVSPDGETMIYGSWDGIVNLYNSKYGPLWVPMTHPGNSHSETWDTENLPEPRLIGHADKITSLDFSPDGSKILTGSQDGTARIWDLNNRISKINAIETFKKKVSSANFSKDGATINVRFEDSISSLYDLNGNLLKNRENIVGGSTFSVYSPTGKTLLTRGNAGNLELLDRNGIQLVNYENDTKDVVFAEFSDDGKYLMTISKTNIIQLLDSVGNMLGIINEKLGKIVSAGFTSHGDKIFSGTAKGEIELLDLRGNLKTFDLNIDTLTCKVLGIRASSNGNYLLIDVENSASKVIHKSAWNHEGERQWEFEITNDNLEVADGIEWYSDLSQDGEYILTTVFDGDSINLWDLKNNKKTEIELFQNIVSSRVNGIPSVMGWPPEIISFIVNLEHKLMIVACRDNTIRLFDLEGKLIMKLLCIGGGIKAIDFSPNTKKILCLYEGGAIEIWDLPSTFEDYVLNKKFLQLSKNQKEEYLIE